MELVSDKLRVRVSYKNYLFIVDKLGLFYKKGILVIFG